MYKENPELCHPQNVSERPTVAGPQPKTISLYPPDLERLMRLCQTLSAHTGRSVSASAMVRVALRKLEQTWTRKRPPSDGDDAA